MISIIHENFFMQSIMCHFAEYIKNNKKEYTKSF